ncbi:uncharacterized protein [Nicotiana tomentosiformis]|uniref:uncharacterized protein n=1 Tax=Nicotiana tomentosiformis TaxID=4098 RepID=UPI00388C99CB
MECLGKDVAMRPPSGDEEIPAPKQAKEKKRKRLRVHRYRKRKNRRGSLASPRGSLASVLHHEVFLRIREEHDVAVQNLTEKSDTYKFLSEKLQDRQRLEQIGRLQTQVNAIEAEAKEFKKNMDILASKKEIVQAQLESAEAQLQTAKEKASVQVEKIKELQYRLDLAISDKASLTDELEVARSEAAVARYEVIVANKRPNAKVAQFRVDVEVNQDKGMIEHMKWQDRGETLEGAQGFDIISEIKRLEQRKLGPGSWPSLRKTPRV